MITQTPKKSFDPIVFIIHIFSKILHALFYYLLTILVCFPLPKGPRQPNLTHSQWFKNNLVKAFTTIKLKFFLIFYHLQCFPFHLQNDSINSSSSPLSLKSCQHHVWNKFAFHLFSSIPNFGHMTKVGP
jgi:hypothetical protein